MIDVVLSSALPTNKIYRFEVCIASDVTINAGTKHETPTKTNPPHTLTDNR